MSVSLLFEDRLARSDSNLPCISLLLLSTERDDFLVALEHQLAHANQILEDLRESLLALVSQKPRPVDQLLVDLLQR